MFGKIGRTVTALLMVLMMIGLVGCSASDNGDTVVMGGSRVIEAGEQIEGDLVVLGGSVEVEKDAVVAGDLTVLGGSVRLNGIVGGDVAVMGGSVDRGATSNIGGEVIALGGNVSRADVGNGVTTGSDGSDEPVRPEGPVRPTVTQAPERPGLIERAIGGVLGMLGTLAQAIAFGALALVLTMFMPDHVRRIGKTAESAPAASFGVGFLTSLAIGLAFGLAILFSFLLIGIPFAILIPLLTAAAWVLGMVGLGYFFGTRMLKGADIRSPRAPAAAAIGTGTLVLVGNVVGWLPVVGWLFGMVMGFWALGAAVLSRAGTQAYPARVAYAASTPIGRTTTPTAERPVPPAASSRGSGNLFADLASDLGLDEEDLMDDDLK